MKTMLLPLALAKTLAPSPAMLPSAAASAAPAAQTASAMPAELAQTLAPAAAIAAAEPGSVEAANAAFDGAAASPAVDSAAAPAPAPAPAQPDPWVFPGLPRLRALADSLEESARKRPRYNDDPWRRFARDGSPIGWGKVAGTQRTVDASGTARRWLLLQLDHSETRFTWSPVRVISVIIDLEDGRVALATDHFPSNMGPQFPPRAMTPQETFYYIEQELRGWRR